MITHHPLLAEIEKNQGPSTEPYLDLSMFVSDYVAARIQANPQARSLFAYDQLHCRVDEALIAHLSKQELEKESLELANTPLECICSLQQVPNFAVTAQGLRRLRHQCMLRIIGRMACGMADTAQTLREISDLAHWCINFATKFCQGLLCIEYGVPKDSQGSIMELLVIGMGKLGVKELNLSSDVDLIFAISGDGQTHLPSQSVIGNEQTKQLEGVQSIDAVEFFTRVGKKIISLLADVNQDGFVFRVDMRLRPYGSCGALIAKFAELERYYFEQARVWERFAMSRARILCGRETDQQFLSEFIESFVYRRHIDFGVIDGLRELRNSIATNQADVFSDDIKISRGGIRELEFFAQAMQLIYGGITPQLRGNSTLQTLQLCGELGLQSEQVCRMLSKAYLWLRDMENRIQALEDKQTHTLPQQPEKLRRIALGMGYTDSAICIDKLQQVRTQVTNVYDGFLDSQQDAHGRKPPVIDSIWQTLSDELFAGNVQMLIDTHPVLTPLSEQLQDFFVKANKCSHATIASLRVVMPYMLCACLQSHYPSNALQAILNLLFAILRRSVYVSLLAENLRIIPWMVSSCVLSKWCAEQITVHPMLLSCYLEQDRRWHKPDRTLLLQQLEQQMTSIAEDDVESQMDSLRYFAMHKRMQAALAQLRDDLSLMQVSDYLSYVAEICIHQACNLAWKNLAARYGAPSEESLEGFAVLAFGKLGGFELSYASDLDLVFIHENQPSNAFTEGKIAIHHNQFYQRLAQRIIHLLSAPTAAGFAYNIDTRLRPNGEKGLICCSLTAWHDYYQTQAWTWEKQALTRARPICGSPATLRHCAEIRLDILRRPIDSQQLCHDIVAMRERIANTHGYQGGKYARGGMIDIEFIVQYLILRHAAEYPDLLTFSDNIRQLQQLEQQAGIDTNRTKQLRDAYLILRDDQHLNYLGIAEYSHDVSQLEPSHIVQAMQQAGTIWEEIFGKINGDQKNNK